MWEGDVSVPSRQHTLGRVAWNAGDDPQREGRVSALEIVREVHGASETVWRYEHDGSQEGHQDGRQIWGFDANAWRGPDRAAFPA